MGNACTSTQAVQTGEPAEDTVEEHVIKYEDEDVIDVQEAYAGKEVDFEAIESEYASLKTRMLAEGTWYNDDIFPAKLESLCKPTAVAPDHEYNTATWRRPHEICPTPYMFKSGIRHEDVIQGKLGDCWFIASIGAISTNSRFISQIIPNGQVLKGKGYVGMVHFKFWRFGKWVDVIVDDQLPTLYQGRKLYMASSSDRNEFWVSLLEKAYAKLHGSYHSLRGGKTADGLTDLTGGIAILYKLGDDTPSNFASLLHKSIRNGSFLCADIGGVIEGSQGNGLYSGHAYSVVGSAKVDDQRTNSKVHLVQVKNPWGGSREWNGAYSDGSDDWNFVSEADKKRIGFADKENGTWWMNFTDFITKFTDTTICSTAPDFDADGDTSGDSWHLTQVNGEWKEGVSAGGYPGCNSFATNPQYLLELKEPDNFDPAFDDEDQRGKCTAVIGLMQEHRRAGRADGNENFSINIRLYKVSGNRDSKLDASFLRRSQSSQVANAKPAYANLRERTLTVHLQPGFYVMVPSTLRQNNAGSFLIRVFTEKTCSVKELSGPPPGSWIPRGF